MAGNSSMIPCGNAFECPIGIARRATAELALEQNELGKYGSIAQKAINEIAQTRRELDDRLKTARSVQAVRKGDIRNFPASSTGELTKEERLPAILRFNPNTEQTEILGSGLIEI